LDLLLDDIASVFRHPEDAAHFPTYAAAHAQLCNRTLEALDGFGGDCGFAMCPTRYHGRPPFDAYLAELGERLDPRIDVYYTGVDVRSPTIDVAEVEAFGRVVRRKPLIWDNVIANDLDERDRLHVGPIRGRSPDLEGHVRGFLINPMNQVEASKVPLATFAAFARDPRGYDPEAAWHDAIRAVAGDGAPAFRRFAETTLRTPLGGRSVPPLEELTGAALAELEAGPDGEATTALLAHLGDLDEACDALKVRTRNYALRQELLPWIEALEAWVWAARFAHEAWRAGAAGGDPNPSLRRLAEVLAEACAHPKKSGGRALLPFVEAARRLAEGV
jgi:hyaluronoglucosaminidase